MLKLLFTSLVFYLAINTVHAAQMATTFPKMGTPIPSAEEQVVANTIFKLIKKTALNARENKKIEDLLKQNPKIVNIKDKDDWTALAHAAFRNHQEATQLCIIAGASPDAGIKGCFTPLMRAALYGHTTIARMLIACNASLDEKTDFDGMTALMYAACNGHEEVICMLIAAGADENIQNEKAGNKTAKDYALSYDHHKAFLRALDKGKKLRTAYLEQQKEAHTMLAGYLLPDLAKIVKGYAFSNAPEDLCLLPPIVLSTEVMLS